MLKLERILTGDEIHFRPTEYIITKGHVVKVRPRLKESEEWKGIRNLVNVWEEVFL